ncbi:ribonucleoside-triphosphate reductase [Salmonella phage 36]|uniref:Ribonucleoside-triphosphate reductase n=1 Tax=Salmonella phage 36 TaxID=1654889 RepID=A0A0N6WGC2_9CAUD|nr:ribonucleoside-triphosphate reductase [Salmonella phage 36]AKJ73999.1 ribonucleoside-triphosphate reductase [Salmonella phage 36]
MNYEQIRSMASAGINFFSDVTGEFDCITQPGSVEIVGGVEVEKPEIKVKIKGLVRAPRTREVDGETIRVTDKLGVFNADVELKTDIRLISTASVMLWLKQDQSDQQALPLLTVQ